MQGTISLVTMRKPLSVAVAVKDLEMEPENDREPRPHVVHLEKTLLHKSEVENTVGRTGQRVTVPSGCPLSGGGGALVNAARSNSVIHALAVAVVFSLASVAQGASTGMAYRSKEPSALASSGWHPARVYYEGGWPRFFQVWNISRSMYQHQVLMGYENIAFGEDLSVIGGRLQSMAAHKVNFIRLWMRPSDGFYAYRYDASQRKVDLDTWNEEFFQRLDYILGLAEQYQIVIEVMLWDRCTGWRGGGLPQPTSWGGWNDGGNVHHPDNHYRSSAGNQPIPGLWTGSEDRIMNREWYNTAAEVWMTYQERYAARVMTEVMKHNNVSIEIINEAPAKGYALVWRQYVHRWLHSQYPEIMLQSEALGGLAGTDGAMRQWGADNPGTVSLVSTHALWTYDLAQARYHAYPGVLPGCNESGDFDTTDLSSVRSVMWGLTFGGGVAYIENVPASIGSVVTEEMYQFFAGSAFWTMRPARDLIVGNDGSRYVLARDDRLEIDVFVDSTAGRGAFTINEAGNYRYRWFIAAGANSYWGPWQSGNTWVFEPPNVNCALQIRKELIPGPCPPRDAPIAGGPSGNITDPTPTFSWGAVPGATSYTLYVVRDSDEAWILREIEILTTTFTPSDPLPTGVQLRWKVKGESMLCQNGAGPYSTISYFQVVPDTPPCRPTQPPVPYAPIGKIRTATPTFTWSAVECATSYTLDVLRDKALLLHQTGITSTSFMPAAALPTGVELRWEVKGESSLGSGPPSPAQYFTISTVDLSVLNTASFGPDARIPGAEDVQEADIPPIDFGYYRVDNVPSGGQSYAHVVKAWTNMAYVDWYADGRAFDSPPAQVVANMQGIMQRVTSQGLSLMMDVGYPGAWGQVLTKADILSAAAPYWGSVKYIILGDELQLTSSAANQIIAEFRTGMTNMGLEPRPIGVTLTPAYVLSDPGILQASFDFIAIEGYTPDCSCVSCGGGSTQAEIDAIAADIADQEAMIPADKSLVMIMQGYDRNGAFTNIDTLAEINRATYFQMVKGKSRYRAIAVFNWHREKSTCPGNPYPAYGHGSSGYPQLQTVHKEIWRDLNPPAERIFADGFESGGFGAWSQVLGDGDLSVSPFAAMAGTRLGMRAVVNDTTSLYVQDDTPNNETLYRARFHLWPNGYDPGEAQGSYRTCIFAGFGADRDQAPVAMVVLRRQSGLYSILGKARHDNGSFAQLAPVTISDAPHAIEIRWLRATGPGKSDGRFELWIDGARTGAIPDINNDKASVEFARLGPQDIKPGANGVLYFDEFDSGRFAVDCDLDHITCKRFEIPCPGNTVHSVFDGCYGPCVEAIWCDRSK